MKKTAILIAIMLVTTLLVLSSCNFGDTLCTHKDENSDHICDLCPEKVSECADTDNNHKCDVCSATLSECSDTDKNHKCDVCSATLSECTDTDKNHKCEICGTTVSECTDADTDHACDVCNAVMGEHKATEDSHTCAYCGKAASECVDSNGDYICDVCGEEKIPDNLERVNYNLNISDLTVETLASDAIHGVFTITSGTTIRARSKTFEGVEYSNSVKIGSAGNKIKVAVPGTGTLSFLVQNGSSGATTQFITVTAPDGAVQDIEFTGTDGGSPVVRITVPVTEGEWIISRGKNGGTQDIFALSLSCIVEKANENGFALVSEGTVDYLAG